MSEVHSEIFEYSSSILCPILFKYRISSYNYVFVCLISSNYFPESTIFLLYAKYSLEFFYKISKRSFVDKLLREQSRESLRAY